MSLPPAPEIVQPWQRHGSRSVRLVLSRQGSPVWARPALLGLLAATALLYLWELGASGWANAFYSAAVQRWFGPAAGLLAGAVVALTPVAALMFRFNDPDALLVLLLTAATYATLRAVEDGRTRWLVLASALIGTAFLAKMLQAFVIVPVVALVYLLAGRARCTT